MGRFSSIAHKCYLLIPRLNQVLFFLNVQGNLCQLLADSPGFIRNKLCLLHSADLNLLDLQPANTTYLNLQSLVLKADGQALNIEDSSAGTYLLRFLPSQFSMRDRKSVV